MKCKDIIKEYGYIESYKNKKGLICYRIDNSLDKTIKDNNINYFYTFCQCAPEIKKLWIFESKTIRLKRSV